MCKEIEERKTDVNIDLGFNKFCDETKRKNAEKFIKMAYIGLQFDNLMHEDDLIPDDLAISIAKEIFVDTKRKGLLDILNRNKSRFN